MALTSSETLAHFEGSPYEKIRNLGGSDITRVGSAVITDLDGILSTDTTFTDIDENLGFLTVSRHHCTRCNFRSPTEAGCPRTTRK